MSDPEEIYLQPECCADESTGRLWCEDDAPVDCEDGKPWTKYVRADLAEQQAAEIARLRTGDTCARMCEGAAYRIEARQLRALLSEADNALRDYVERLEKQGGSMNYGRSVLSKIAAALAEQKGEK